MYFCVFLRVCPGAAAIGSQRRPVYERASDWWERVMWFVFEAEYQIENGRANWNKPVPETIAWHGPFESAAEADRVVRGRMWAKIDIYSHKARAVDLTVKE